jgi:tetratricopeptide (TPR) repeat protein
LNLFCSELARGYAELRTNPTAALASAERAGTKMPTRAEPQVLKGRALLALERPDAAYAALHAAFGAQPQALQASEALHDYAVAAALAGDLNESRQAFRVLVPRASLFDETVREQLVYIEASNLAMTRGESGLNEAIGFLSQAQRRGLVPGLRVFAVASLALALDRQGRAEQARGVLSELEDASVVHELAEALEQADEAPAPERPANAGSPVRWSARSVPTPSPGGNPALRLVFPDGELYALSAVLAERADRELAAERWQSYLKSQACRFGPWAEHARRKLARSGARNTPVGRSGDAK